MPIPETYTRGSRATSHSEHDERIRFSQNEANIPRKPLPFNEANMRTAKLEFKAKNTPKTQDTRPFRLEVVQPYIRLGTSPPYRLLDCRPHPRPPLTLPRRFRSCTGMPVWNFPPSWHRRGRCGSHPQSDGLRRGAGCPPNGAHRHDSVRIAKQIQSQGAALLRRRKLSELSED